MIFTEIQKRLLNAEVEHGVSVIFAIESGSRAWGFGSPNSDYDARFIYVNSIGWYLSINSDRHRDVIEYPIVDEVDINGWDLKKALKLYWKSNPGIVEWIQSPIEYKNDGHLKKYLVDLLPEFYSFRNGGIHYLNMAKNNYRQYLKNDIVPIKKYFYVLRPLLACDWIVRNMTAPPIEFDKLVSDARLSSNLLDEINKLLTKKKSSLEMSMEPAVGVINEYIEFKFQKLNDAVLKLEEREGDVRILNELFKKYLNLLSHE
jgi:predicted nucleotidyltransferase